MNKKILILGKGFIGSRLQKGLDAAVCTSKIRQFKDAQRIVEKYRPKILINCIGSTGTRNVDDCEILPEKTLSSNTFVPIYLAEAAIRNNIKFVHISSGCIYHYNFKKDKPITETQTPDYFGLFYSRSKIYAERVMETLSRQKNILIVRLRVPLDDRPHPKNLLTKLLKYQTIIDVPNSVTYIPEFIAAFKHLLKRDARGIYNVAAKKPLRYPHLMALYKKYVPDFQYRVIPYHKLKLTRTNLVLSMRKLEKTGFKLRPLNGILKECVENYLKY